ncbi:MAG: pilus assembly protein N-terminal domain-containing protein [Gemmataceae bacterium]
MARIASPSRATRHVRFAAFAALAAAALGVCGDGRAQQPGNKPAPLPIGVPGPAAGTPAPFQGLPEVVARTGFQPETKGGTAAQPAGPYAGPLSNPLLSPGPNGLPKASQPSAATQEKISKYVAKLLDPESTLDLVTGQTRVMVLKGTPIRIQSGDESVLAVSVVSPKEILLHGKGVGATVLNVWFGDKNDPTKQETLTYLVRIFPDPEAKERLERAYKTLEDELNKYFKDTSLRLKLVGDKLVVSGRVRDYQQGNQVLQIIKANMSGSGAGGASDASKAPIVPAGGVPDAATPISPEAFQSAGGNNVINLLEVAGEQQVMLRVVVCEVSRAAARSVGLNFSVMNQQGVTVFANKTGPVIGGLGGLGQGLLGGGFGGGGFGFGGQIANVAFNLDATRLPFALSALKQLQYARSLAEPTLVTMNGQTANFLAGGSFPVPVIGGFGSFGGGGGLQGVQYVPYGVIVNYTPHITDRDRLRLALNATVSTRDVNTSTNIGGGQVAGLNSRSVNTTVELRQGETLAIAGLIEYNVGADSTRLPFIGDIPGLNNLTGLQRTQAGEKELVIFITPELVRPLDPGQVAKLPGSEILEPNDCEFYLLGRLEGHCKDWRGPIRTDLSRIRMYHTVEQSNIYGPAGYSPQTYP